MSNICKKKNNPLTFIQWDGNNSKEVVAFAEGSGYTPTGNVLIFSTNYTSFTLRKGDYLIKDGKTLTQKSEEAFEAEYEKEGE